MKFRNCIFACLIIFSFNCFSQPFFSNIDSLLTKNIEALNKQDSVYYLSLLNMPAVFKGKNAATKADSIVVLKQYTSTFRDVIESMKEMVLSSDFTVAYSGYDCVYKKTELAKANGKILLKVSLILNDSFVARMPFEIYAHNGKYSIETPMMDMFIEEKE